MAWSDELNTPLTRDRYLQAGLDLIDQGFTLIDENLRMVAWNRAFLRLLDFPDAMAYVGAPFESFIRYNAERGDYGPGDPEQLAMTRVREAEAFRQHDIERVRPNGTVLRVRGVPVPGHGFVTLYSDITEQKRSEGLIREQNAQLESRVAERTVALQRSEAQMRLITDSIPALVAYFTHERVYRYVNRGYRDWFGLDVTQPQNVSAREYLGADTYTRIRPNVLRALQGEPVTFEYEANTCDGLKRVARTSLIPERNTQGQVIGCFELTFDISQERRSHELVVRAEKMEALAQLTGGFAHDFNNILTVVLGNLAALSEHAELRPYAADYIVPAMDAAKRGSELIQGLLSFSHQRAVHQEAVLLQPLLLAVDKLVRHSLPGSLALHTDGGPEALRVGLDPSQLQNALLNLLLNARDATDARGEVHLRAMARRLQGQEAAMLRLAPGDYACVQVQDNGCGMDEATRARVFEPFFTTKVPGRGTGLGLSMVYGFVNRCGGMVDVQSEPGRGTTISLWFPLSDVPLPTGSTSPRFDDLASADPGHKGLALLVEDDDAVRQIVRRLLLDLGYVVLEAENGVEALQILEQTPGIRLLLSDVVMPGGLDGPELCRQASGRVEQMLLMSAYAPAGASDAGVPILSKPFTKAELLAQLQAFTEA